MGAGEQGRIHPCTPAPLHACSCWASAWLGAQINAAADAPVAAQIAGAELARVRDVLKAVNAHAKHASAAMPQILAALRDTKPSERLPSPAQLMDMLNAPAFAEPGGSDRKKNS